MSWTQERITTTLGDLDAPRADEAFWERVHNDLLTHEPDAQEITILMSPSDQPMAEVHALVRSPWRARWYIAASAAAALLITGLYAVGHSPDQTPEGSPSPRDVVLTDPLALSLDDQPRTAEPVVPRSEYVVVDLTELPEGWTATVNSASALMSPPTDSYRADYILWSPTGKQFVVIILSGGLMSAQGGTPVDINGHAGLQDHQVLSWEQERGVDVQVTPTELRYPDAAADLTAAGRSLTFESVRELPFVIIDPDATPFSTGAQFAGTLNGIRYVVRANPGPLRGMTVYAGDDPVAGIQEDRQSQPTDDPQTAGSVRIVGVAGYGVIVFGYTDPATAALRADLADGSTIQVPVLRNPGETYFALPVPLGVDVASLDFLDVRGDTLRTATMPTLPAYFGECCASAPWTTDVESASSSAPTTP